MAYADYVADPTYRAAQSGAGVKVLLYDELDTTVPILGAVSGINASEPVEQNAVEEAGNEGVDEYVDGRITGSLSLQGFWTPERNDSLPTRTTFIGKTYIIMEKIPPVRRGLEGDTSTEDLVVNVYVGCKLSSIAHSHGARGLKTLNLEFVFERRYSGQEWATLSGN